MSHELLADLLLDGLSTTRVGREISVLTEVDSTNSHVLNRIALERGQDADGFVLFAEHQTAGRGRLGRSWNSPRGAGLTFSVLLWERPQLFSTARVIMATALGVVRGVERSTEVEPVIHWPNDVYVKGRKLGGILVEARACGESAMPVAVGIGLNCMQQPGHFSEELRDKATSLEIESRCAVDRIAVARAILQEMDILFAMPVQMSDSELAAAWSEKSADMGQRVTIFWSGESFTGCVLDVHPQTGLLMQLDSGLRRQFDLATISRAAEARP